MTLSTLLWVTVSFALLLPLLFRVLSILGAECKQPHLSLQTFWSAVFGGVMSTLCSHSQGKPVWRRQQRAGDWKEDAEDSNLHPEERWVPQHPAATGYTHVKWPFLPIFCHQAQFPLWPSAYFKVLIRLLVMVSIARMTIFVRVFRTSWLLPTRRMLAFL